MTDALQALQEIKDYRVALIHEEADALFERDSPKWNKYVDERLVKDAEWDQAAAEQRRLWDSAKPATPDHPYLARKGITSAPGLRVDGDWLLVPMKGLEPHSPLMNVQRIPAKPARKKLFGKGAKAGHLRLTIGSSAFNPQGTLYLCEGWATGWSIHEATAQAVVVCFSADNLEKIASAMRKQYPDANLVIAADNDRGKDHNTGVESANKAARACEGRVAVPQFANSEGTDFDDLRQQEGLAAVKRWLESAAPPSMNGTAPEPEIEPPPEEEEEEVGDERPRSWLDRAPFRCLGHDRGTYYFLPDEGGQIVPMSPAQLDRATFLYQLAPASWWLREFPGKQAPDTKAAADALIQAAHALGVYHEDRVRGVGCWPERQEDGGTKVLLHLGDRLLPGAGAAFVRPETYRPPTGALIYERLAPIDGPSTAHALSLDDARRVLSLFEDLRWYDDASGLLLAGWTALAPLSGALDWRPHVWITGESGGGKSTVLKTLVVPLLGGTQKDDHGMAAWFEGNTTEAGVRQELLRNALPVVIDEAENESDASDRRIQGVLALARSSSSSAGASVAKGTAGGHAMSFIIRSMFCLASIGGAVRAEADKTRVTILQLRGGKTEQDKEERADHWEAYAPRLPFVTREIGRELFARTLGWLRDGRLQETLDVMRAQAAVVLEQQRAGDQYGTLFAGAWTLTSDQPPTAEEARALISDHGVQTYLTEQTPEGLKVLQAILQTEARVDTSQGPKTYAVGELIDASMSDTNTLRQDADAWLKTHGLRTEVRDGTRVLELANSSDWIANALRGTPYADGWPQQLRGLPGVSSGQTRRFHSGLRSRVTVVPRDSFDAA